jgi:oligoribonuclease
MAEPKYLGFTDLETTGLDIDADFILEIGIVLTDLEFNVVQDFNRVILMSSTAMDRLEGDKFVTNMHERSGLLKILLDGKGEVNLYAAETKVVSWLTKLGVRHGDIAMGGSGIARFDMPWIEKHMPRLFQFFHYRPLDITVFRNLIKLFIGNTGIDPVAASFQDGVKAHRALPDAYAHLEETVAYREWFRDLTGFYDKL